jgi:hypothetical protein
MHGRLRKEYEELARRSVPDETLPEPSAYERLSGSEQVLRSNFSRAMLLKQAAKKWLCDRTRLHRRPSRFMIPANARPPSRMHYAPSIGST